jgi:hypothetical protein
MTRHALRSATILIIIQSLLFFPAPVSRAQDDLRYDDRPTRAERKLAQQASDLFVKRLDETGDFSRVIDEMYARDFIERYLREEMRKAEESGLSSDVYFGNGLECDGNLLKQATVEDWRRFYIAVNNFIYHAMVAAGNRHADEILNDRFPGDDEFCNTIPPKVIELFNNQPALKRFPWIDCDHQGVGVSNGESQGHAAQEKSGPKTIETPEEMRDVTSTLHKALRLLLEEHGDHARKLTKRSKSAIDMMARKRIENEGGKWEPGIKILDKDRLGLPAGTRILLAPTPVSYALVIAEAQGKQKILGASCVIGE